MTTVVARISSLALVLVLACGAFALRSAAAPTTVHAAGFPPAQFIIESVGRPLNGCATDVDTTNLQGAGRVETHKCNGLSIHQRWTSDSSGRLKNQSTGRCITVTFVPGRELVATSIGCLTTVKYQWSYDPTTQHILGGGSPAHCWRNFSTRSPVVITGSCSKTDDPSKWVVAEI